jgi:hypothetical protein
MSYKYFSLKIKKRWLEVLIFFGVVANLSCKPRAESESELEKVKLKTVLGQTEIYAVPVLDKLSYCFVYDVSTKIGPLDLRHKTAAISTPITFADFLAGYASVKSSDRDREIINGITWSILNTIQMVNITRRVGTSIVKTPGRWSANFKAALDPKKAERLRGILEKYDLLSSVFPVDLSLVKSAYKVKLAVSHRPIQVANFFLTEAAWLSLFSASQALVLAGDDGDGFGVQNIPGIADMIRTVKAIKSIVNVESVYRDWGDLTSTATKTVDYDKYDFLRSVLKRADALKSGQKKAWMVHLLGFNDYSSACSANYKN